MKTSRMVDKRLSVESNDNKEGDENIRSKSPNHPKQSRSGPVANAYNNVTSKGPKGRQQSNVNKDGHGNVASTSSSKVISGSSSDSMVPTSFARYRSKSTTSYLESSKLKWSLAKGKGVEANNVKVIDGTIRLGDSLRSAFQMPPNLFHNLNNISFPDYLSQLPQMPSMPNISIPNITMPTISMPSMPSMPNLSMPNISMPSMPSMNLNIPSISEIMNFQRKHMKTWPQICDAVRESRRRYSSVCFPLPFEFNHVYNEDRRTLRIYFLSCNCSAETSLYYCDVPLDPAKSDDDNNSLVDRLLEEDEDDDDDFEEQDFYQDKLKHVPRDSLRQNNLTNSTSSNNHSFDHDRKAARFLDMDINDLKYVDEMDISSAATSASDESMDMKDVESDGRAFMQRATSLNSLMLNLDKLEWKRLIYITRNCLDNIYPPPISTSPQQSTSPDSSPPIKKMNTNRVGGTNSQEEDLVLQRKRILFSGIISYDFHPASARFVFTVKNVILWFEDSEIKHNEDFVLSPPYVPKKLNTSPLIKMNATFCPDNPELVAFVADFNVWVCDLTSGVDMPLTMTKHASTSISAGVPSFVMQEEFLRFSGFWWRPACKEKQDDVYTILVEFVDESLVEKVSIIDGNNDVETHRFPRAGNKNAKSSLKLVHFDASKLKTRPLEPRKHVVKIEDLTPSLEDIFDQYEYLIRCDWYDRDVLWAQLLNRKQNKLVIVLISVEKRFPAQIIWQEEHENHWFNVHDAFHFYKANHDELSVGSQVTFLWSSELSGFRHLYKISVTLQGQPDCLIKLEDPQRTSMRSQLVSQQQLTDGKWEVGDTNIWVDEQRDLVYFMANKDSPLERHLYVVSASSTRIPPRRLTREDYSHSVSIFSAQHQFCISFQSNLTTPPYSYFYKVNIPEHAPHMVNLEAKHVFFALPEDISNEDSCEVSDTVQSLGTVPQLFEYKLKSGELVYGFLIKPDFMEPGYKYPVFLEIYGGPGVQFVTKSFKDVRQHRRHLIANEGYIVVCFDSRGSKNRGVEFERHILERLGQVEVEDQVEALQWLALNTDFIDMSRVAIHGWSYGGYLSLMALAFRPDVFKCAIAGAPVTNWKLYDTGYTERYMGLPEDNEDGYRLSSVVTYASQFPNEHNRLLIIHGMMDENVHFAHTSQLINALIAYGKPYSLNIFPYERHSLRKVCNSEHYEATLLQYLQQNL